MMVTVIDNQVYEIMTLAEEICGLRIKNLENFVNTLC